MAKTSTDDSQTLDFSDVSTLRCYKGFEPSLNLSNNYGSVEDCEANPILGKRGVRLACYTRIISESGGKHSIHLLMMNSSHTFLNYRQQNSQRLC